MTEVADKMVADLVATVADLRHHFQGHSLHRGFASSRRSDMREHEFELRVRDNANNLPALKALVQKQDGQRCFFRNSLLVARMHASAFGSTHNKYKQLLTDIAARSTEFSKEQLSQIAELAMTTNLMLDRCSPVGRHESERDSTFEDAPREVYKRVSNGDFSGLDYRTLRDLQELRLSTDPYYGSKLRRELTVAVNKMLDHFAPVEDPRDADEWNYLRYGPWFVPPWARWGWGHRSLEREIDRHSSADPSEKRNGDKLARALLAENAEEVARYNLTEALDYARHHIDGDELAVRVQQVKADAHEVNNLLLKLKDAIERGEHESRLSYIIATVALRRVHQIIEKAKLPRGPSMVVSGSHSAKLADPCRHVIGLLAEVERKRQA